MKKIKRLLRKYDIFSAELAELFLISLLILILSVLIFLIYVGIFNPFDSPIEVNEYTESIEIVDIKVEHNSIPIIQMVGKVPITTYQNSSDYIVIVRDSNHKKYEINNESLFYKYNNRIGEIVKGVFKEKIYKDNKKVIDLIDIIDKE